MRALAVHEDVVVVESGVWRTTCTLIRSGDEAFVIDSPVLPEELELLPAVAEQSGFAVSGLLATHGDWDHVLGRLAFPGAAMAVAETTAARMRADPGAAQRELRAFDERFYLERKAALALGQVEALAVPGYVELGEHELELHPTDGHTVDGMAIWAPWLGVLVCGDYLSTIEIPTPGAGIDAYLATLGRLERLVEQARHVVPGHGPVQGRDEALTLIGEDRAYLAALRSEGAQAPLPAARRGAEQRRLHAENAARLS
ncbi:MAG: MBL fold metallo-hydrolase [Solirubrobacteraceae bacterium]|jgi:glyoxylase-like metal-dependent hydrolase (beta-lactamase superfamily II)